ncbi:hypothetical protein LTR53_007686 [Teratosphaeriaceae sp. CCFEE 6253]|nr:hypothetical protein LTR53_007686 [Teratosphaeriaceae sp. CCFEE 6253]
MPYTAPPPPPKVAKPSRSIFDPFNSSATGHQRADNRLSGSTSWRDSRSLKLRKQFNSGAGGGERVSDTVGAGSLDFGVDGRTENGGFVPGAKGLRGAGQQSLWESTGGVKVEKEGVERAAKRVKLEEGREKPTKVVNPWTPFRREDGGIRESSWTSHESSPSALLSPIDPASSSSAATATSDTAVLKVEDDVGTPEKAPPPQIFRTLNFYINGSTLPTISDHKLKHLLSAHGGNLSISLGRRTVTHVIVGRPSSAGGCGGGLAGSKLQKEITKKRGESVRYVTVDWVVESIKAGKRLPERDFEGVRTAPVGVGSVASMFGKGKKSDGDGEEAKGAG